MPRPCCPTGFSPRPPAGSSRPPRSIIPARPTTRRAGHARWLDVSSTIDGAVALQGVLDAEAGPRCAGPLVELARQNLDSGELPRTGGEHPQVHITVPLTSAAGSAESPRRRWRLAR